MAKPADITNNASASFLKTNKCTVTPLSDYAFIVEIDDFANQSLNTILSDNIQIDEFQEFEKGD